MPICSPPMRQPQMMAKDPPFAEGETFIFSYAAKRGGMGDRIIMTGRNNGGCRRFRSGPPTAGTVPPVPTGEPPMRRWPHPTGEQGPSEDLTAELRDLRRAVDCQTGLLMELRSLLERLTADRP